MFSIIYIYNWAIGLISSVSKWPGFNLTSIYTKESKMVLDAALLKTQHYKVRIKGKVERSKE